MIGSTLTCPLHVDGDDLLCFTTEEDGWACTSCGEELKVGAQVARCEECDATLCGHCVGCASHLGLECCTTEDDHGTCCSCKEDFKSGTRLAGCSECNQHWCLKCMQALPHVADLELLIMLHKSKKELDSLLQNPCEMPAPDENSDELDAPMESTEALELRVRRESIIEDIKRIQSKHIRHREPPLAASSYDAWLSSRSAVRSDLYSGSSIYRNTYIDHEGASEVLPTMGGAASVVPPPPGDAPDPGPGDVPNPGLDDNQSPSDPTPPVRSYVRSNLVLDV